MSQVLQQRKGQIVEVEDIETGYQMVQQHTAAITDAAFSPDGTALATAALDGIVMFFQVIKNYL